MKFNLSLLALPIAVFATEKNKKAPPPFFLQDTKDSKCLNGEVFQRCSVDTLFYVVGKPGKYQIRKRPVDGIIDESEDGGLCLSKKKCDESAQDLKIMGCSHCGSKEWNILGDSDTGYVLTEGSEEGKKLCVIREGTKAVLASCDSEDVAYTPLQLQFTSETDIKQMSSPAGRLIGAATDGDVKLVQELLKDGTDVNTRDWDELTALIPAASAGNLEIVKILVEKGADINAADKDGITALMEASIMGHASVVEFLISKGADVEATAKSEVSALWLASGEGKTDVLKVLLKSNADSGNTRVDGITALMTASVGGHADAVKLLIENGADPTVTDNDGLTPLMNAAEKGDVACLKALTEKTDADFLNQFSKTGFSALIIAAAHGHTEAAGYLIDAGADINAVHDENKVTALMYAAASNHVEVLKLLMDKGADLEFEHSNGGTALLEAATGGAAEAMEAMLKGGSKYDFYDSDGVSPLMAVASQGSLAGQKLVIEYLQKTMNAAQLKEHINKASFSGGTSVMFAAAGGHTECAKELIALGANINDIARATPDYLVKLKKMIEEGTVDKNEDPHIDGVTAVQVAAQGGHLECVNMLIEAGATVTIEDDEKRTPIYMAVKGNHGEVAKALVAAGADPNTPYVDDDKKDHNLLYDAILVENIEFAKLLIEKGADLYYKDEKMVTTLLQASHRGLNEVVAALLAKSGGKSDYLNEASDEGITPLIAAASEGHAEIIQMLIDAKADVNVKDKDGTNSLMAASARGHKDIVGVLLKGGATVNEQNSDGHTALMFAYNGKNQVETLWERFSQYLGGEDKVEDKDDAGTGPLIKDALANHTVLIDLLLKAGADTSLKDKEGNSAKDFDFHPDADAEIIAKEVKDESKSEL